MKKAQEYNSNLGNSHGIQLIKRYPEEPGRQGRHHHESHIISNLPDWHPTYTRLSLEWTNTGKWVSVPKHDDHVGPEPWNYSIGSRERYIDEKGQMKEAIAYGLDEKNQAVWYDLEAIREAIPMCKIPSSPVHSDPGPPLRWKLSCGVISKSIAFVLRVSPRNLYPNGPLG